MKLKLQFAALALVVLVIVGVASLRHDMHHAGAQSSASTPVSSLVIPNCPDTAGQHLTYTSSAMACGSTSPRTVLTGTTGSIGGSLILLNASVTGTATVTGAVTGQPCLVSPSDGSNMLALGVDVSCNVTSANTVTVTLYAIVAVTPAAKTYNVVVP